MADDSALRQRTPHDADEGEEVGDASERGASTSSRRSTLSRSHSTGSSNGTGASTPRLGRGGLSFTGGDGSSIFTSREDVFGGGLPLFDLLVSVDAHLDLLGRRMKPLTDEWKARAQKTRDELDTRLERMKEMVNIDKLGKRVRERKERDLFRQGRSEAEKEFREFREKVKVRVKNVQDRWNDSKTVSLRDKISFFCAVNNVLGTSLLLAFWPQYIPMAYSLQAVYYLPLRIYTYKRIAYHYFLFDMCYYVNALTLLYLWVFPSSPLLFEACYGLSHGPLASAIATWRNSLVFHSLEKVTSLFIHIYPPLVFTVLRHFHPDPSASYPAVAQLPTLSFTRHFLICSFLYLLWQGLYYQFVIVWRASKIASGGRVTSFTWLLNSKKGVISNLLHKIRPERRAGSFIAAQYVYTLITMLPGYFLLYDSKIWSGFYLWAMFGVSVWNGASFYMDVFGKRFEKEFNKLKKELDELNRELSERAAATNASATSPTDEQGASLSAPQLGVVTPTEAYDTEPEGEGETATGGTGAITPTSSRPMSREPSGTGSPAQVTDSGLDTREATPRPGPSHSKSDPAPSSLATKADRVPSDLSIAAEEQPALAAVTAEREASDGSEAGEEGGSSGGSVPGSASVSGSESWIDVEQTGKKTVDVVGKAAEQPA